MSSRAIAEHSQRHADEQNAAARRLRVRWISSLGVGLYWPETRQPYGGAELQFHLLASALAKDPAFEVVVLTSVPGQTREETRNGLTVVGRCARGRAAGVEGARGLARMAAWPRYGAAFWDMLRTLRCINAEVYLQAGAGIEVGAYALIARLLRRRFVYVVASSADLRNPHGGVTRPLKRLFDLGVRMADAVVCRTEEQRRWLRERYGREGVLIRTAYPVPEAREPSALQWSLLWAGRCHPVKQPHLFLDLAERVRPEPCAMVLMRDEAQRELMEEIRQRVKVLPHVTLLEDQPWSRLDRHFEAAKVHVNTSQYEGFPNSFVQAAMHGTPILSFLVNPDGVLAAHDIGACAEGSFDRLAELALRFCRDEDYRRRCGAHAASYARAHHALDSSAASLKNLLGQLIERHAGWARAVVTATVEPTS